MAGTDVAGVGGRGEATQPGGLKDWEGLRLEEDSHELWAGESRLSLEPVRLAAGWRVGGRGAAGQEGIEEGHPQREWPEERTPEHP